jgi:hypothetical protein
MDINAKLNKLTEDIAAMIADKVAKRKQARKKAFVLNSLAVALAAAITVLLGMEGLGPAATPFKNVALAFGAIITVVNAWEAFYNHRGLWIMHTIAWVKLLQLQKDIDYYTAGREPDEVEPKEVDRFGETYRKILHEDFAEWIRIRGRGEGTGSVSA